MSYLIAMLNRRAKATHLHPQTFMSDDNEFLIVSRSGGRNEFLTISNAGACSGREEEEAPAELTPETVLHATLVSQGHETGDIFVVEREKRRSHDDKTLHLAGDGYILLRQTENQVRLTGAARLWPGSHPHPDAALPCATVEFDAIYVPWAFERPPVGFIRGWQVPPTIGQSVVTSLR